MRTNLSNAVRYRAALQTEKLVVIVVTMMLEFGPFCWSRAWREVVQYKLAEASGKSITKAVNFFLLLSLLLIVAARLCGARCQNITFIVRKQFPSLLRH
jgi:hypothetical protein